MSTTYQQRINYSLLVVLIVLLTTCEQPQERKLPYYNTSDFTPHFDKEVSDNFHRIRPFKLTAHTGQAFTEKNMDGKICVANFFFTTCPGICPRMTINMKVLQDTFLLDKNIQLISHSVTPDKDSVARLQAFAKSKKVDARKWLLLTGSKEEIYNLGRKFYFVEEDLGEKRDTDVFLHTENFVLTDKKRRIRGIYNGLNISSVQNLIADIRALEKE
ncbi:SCO family protein [Spirosoma sp. KCTC 42546]|uniref:SCO family protein n=1 Tax=Spirosoma sp. KCTC 42546 TaxID=2520506 RepID=UPI00115A80F7|nr:SCO family protein [Spirosoma sp. KCTC 42546]QDK79323.1 SCO family protein [Spirosoma sp. KCTC 42546]